ncbi:ROK family glucokinase [Streptomyces sp. NPDC058953]|uniref:ROK family glucokinase n=1 Tax=Streptomyces sp. NPDC058953 TaxID=3346676 RepID=UPI0036BA0089
MTEDATTPEKDRPPLVALDRVSKYYGNIRALEGVSLEVGAGEITCVLGDNGAGKSTLIKIIAGLHQHDAGTFAIDGEETRLANPRAALDRGIATVYQDLAVVPLMPVWRNFFLGSEPVKGSGPLRRLDVGTMRETTRSELLRMGIDLRDVDQPIGTLSGGERQCVAIARAVHFGAKVLVLDLSDRHDVHAVGIGAAGWVDADRSTVLFAPHLAWRNEPLRDALSARLAVPVLVDNDANTAAWAEWRFGAGRGEDHLVMITLGTGIGGAILQDGQVKRGKYGVAGEFGHMQVVPGGHRCPCGNRGCWEQYSSGNALVREARELAAADSPVAHVLLDRVGGTIGDITGPLITELAREGDAMCVELFQDIGQWLGVGIANLAAALDPSCFVVGGGVSAADDLLIGPARDAFRRHLTGRGYRPEARIVKAELGPEAGMVGAADLARLVARRFRRANRRRVERHERYERYAQALRNPGTPRPSREV